MKEQILKLRSEGKTYKQIKEILKCSLSTVCYYCGENQPEKTKKRLNDFRNKEENISMVKLRRRYYNTFIFYDKTKNKKKKEPINFSFEDFLQLLKDNPFCYLSGLLIDYTDNNSWQIDHIIPSSKGGKTIISNLKPCLSWANHMKNNHSLSELKEKCILITNNLLK